MKAAALRREIREANGPKPVKKVKPTKLELDLENIRLKQPVVPPDQPVEPLDQPVESPDQPDVEPVEQKTTTCCSRNAPRARDTYSRTILC